MSADLQTFLTARAADPDTVHQAMRAYMARTTDFMSEDQMRAKLLESVGDERQLQQALKALESDATLLEAASLATLSEAWADPQQQKLVERAVDGARASMPVIEVGMLAIVAMYGMYLQATGGKKTEEIVRRKLADGSFETVKRTTYYGPSGPLSAITGLFTKGAASG
jgi:hypothetical protein